MGIGSGSVCNVNPWILNVHLQFSFSKLSLQEFGENSVFHDGGGLQFDRGCQFDYFWKMSVSAELNGVLQGKPKTDFS